MKFIKNTLLILILLVCISILSYPLFIDKTELNVDTVKLEIDRTDLASASSIKKTENISQQSGLEITPIQLNQEFQQSQSAGVDVESIIPSLAEETISQKMLATRYGDFINSLALTVEDENELSSIMIGVLDSLKLQVSTGVITQAAYPELLLIDMEAVLRTYLIDEEMNIYFDYEAEKAETVASARKIIEASLNTRLAEIDDLAIESQSFIASLLAEVKTTTFYDNNGVKLARVNVLKEKYNYVMELLEENLDEGQIVLAQDIIDREFRVGLD